VHVGELERDDIVLGVNELSGILEGVLEVRLVVKGF